MSSSNPRPPNLPDCSTEFDSVSNQPVRVLLVEDSDADAARTTAELQSSGLKTVIHRAENREAFLEALATFAPDIILCDYSLPQFDGMDAIGLTKEHAPGVPLIVVTGSINEETAVECMKAGAVDYVLKEHLNRLGPAVQVGLGYTPDELLGKRYDALLTGDPSDSEVRAKTDKALRYGLQGQSYRAIVRHKDGRNRTLEIVESPLLRRGKVNDLKNLGVTRFLTKPFTAEELLIALHEELTAQKIE